MPRPAKPARLYLRNTDGRPAVWVILHRGREISTGCGAGDTGGAEKAFQAYLGQAYTPPTGPRPLDGLLIADVLTLYLRERAPLTRSLPSIMRAAAPLLAWWDGKTLAAIKGQSCRDYAAWRMATEIKPQATTRPRGPRAVRFVGTETARAELAYLSAAINHYHKEHGPLPAVPAVTLPDKSPPRERWLTRTEAAGMIRAACRDPLSRHIARFVLLGAYTGTRSQAIFGLRWLPSTTGGWVDLDAGVIHRRGQGVAESSKRQPPLKIPDRLLPHLVRWRAIDQRAGITHAVHFQGAKITKLRRSWATARKRAGLGAEVTPHILRHTAATWLMQSACDIYEAAGFLGMSAEMLERVYGHHHPDFQSAAANATRRRAPMKSQETPRTKRDEADPTPPKHQQKRGA